MNKHKGSIDDLRSMIGSAGFTVASCDEKGSARQIRTEEGAIVNWYPSTGTVQYQGDKEESSRLKNALSDLTGAPAAKFVDVDSAGAAVATPEPRNKKVFVVHGHDVQAREQLELVLHKLGLDPFVLQNSSGGGLTIIEALEKEIGPRIGAARFGIVLLTPDDVGYAKSDGAEKAEPRARQNVVLEAGMLISSLGRGNVAILKKGHLDVPSDAQGIIYIAFSDHVKEAVPRLADRLSQAGFVISPACITNASS